MIKNYFFRKSTYVFILILLGGIYSCNDFIEEDISGDVPILILPQNGDTISEFSSFIWNPLEGANKYRLEIQSPDFDSPSFIAVDTVVSGTDIFLTLSPNKYQLRLRALNNGYESLTTDPINFWVDTISSNQTQIDLLTPSPSAYYSESFNGPFSWSSLPNVSSYEISVRSGTDYETGAILYSQNGISTISHTVSGVTFSEGEYIWGVKATFNQGNSTNVYTNTFMIDGTDPGAPNPQTPADFATVTSPVEITWTNPTDVGQIQSPVTTHIDIATDVNFNNIIQSTSTQSNTIDITINQSGTYYWSLYNVDEAGNQSGYSTTREFTIN